VIIRIMGEGQYQVEEGLVSQLNELDAKATSALEAGDETTLRELLRQMAETVRSGGTRLDDAELAPSEGIVPPEDLSLEEAKELFSGEGLIPDLPVQG
jgi:hypothetical protein